MVKKLYTESNIQDIATAIREKNGSSDTYTTAQMPAAIRAIPTGGGSTDVVNGLIEYYLASSGTVDANTFVEFVNGKLSDTPIPGLDTEVSSATNSYSYVSAVKLNDNTVFIAHRGGSYLYGTFCTISGKTVTVDATGPLDPNSNSYRYASAVALNENTVFIAHPHGSYLYGTICRRNGSTVISGPQVQLSSVSSPYDYDTSAVKLNENAVFVAYRGGSQLYGVVCRIAYGTNIILTPGTPTQLTTDANSYFSASAVALNENTVFVAHGVLDANYNYKLYGLVCAISGTTITLGVSSTQLLSENVESLGISAVALSSSAVFITNKILDEITYNDWLYGVVCNITNLGTTIHVGTNTQLVETVVGGGEVNVAATSDKGVFIAFCGANDSSLYGIGCDINYDRITPGTATQLLTDWNTGFGARVVTLSESSVFIAHQVAGLHLGGLVVTAPTVIQASTTKIDGLTKTAATTSTPGDVWVLDN